MKQPTRTLTALAATALIGLGVAVGPATHASAATIYDEWMYTDDGDPGGRVQFKAYGDIMRLCDIEADGYAVYLEVWDYNTGALQYNYQIGGNGRCIELRASLGGKYDLTEGHAFRVKISLAKDGYGGYYRDEAIWLNDN
jgi:hypothetical protein